MTAESRRRSATLSASTFLGASAVALVLGIAIGVFSLIAFSNAPEPRIDVSCYLEPRDTIATDNPFVDCYRLPERFRRQRIQSNSAAFAQQALMRRTWIITSIVGGLLAVIVAPALFVFYLRRERRVAHWRPGKLILLWTGVIASFLVAWLSLSVAGFGAPESILGAIGIALLPMLAVTGLTWKRLGTGEVNSWLIVCDSTFWIEATKDDRSESASVVALAMSQRHRLGVSKHSLTELDAGAPRYGPAASQLARSFEQLPYYPLGTIDELLGSISELSGSFDEMRQNESLRSQLGQVASQGTSLRDRGALIDALWAKAQFFVSSDHGLVALGPRKRIESSLSISVRTPAEMARELRAHAGVAG